MSHPKKFSSFSHEWGELLIQTKFFAVGTSLVHLSMKKFSDWSYHLFPKIRQNEDAEGCGNQTSPPPPPLNKN